MPDSERHGADIMVLIEHPYGDVECSLAQWISTGPGACCARPRLVAYDGRGTPPHRAPLPVPQHFKGPPNRPTGANPPTRGRTRKTDPPWVNVAVGGDLGDA